MAFHKTQGIRPLRSTEWRRSGRATRRTGGTVKFVTNGVGPVIGAPYHEPCRDDRTGQKTADGKLSGT